MQHAAYDVHTQPAIGRGPLARRATLATEAYKPGDVTELAESRQKVISAEPLPHRHQALGSPLPHLKRDWA
jgi:hypothetical protein